MPLIIRRLPSGKVDLGQIGIGDMPADVRAAAPLPPKRTPEEEEARANHYRENFCR